MDPELIPLLLDLGSTRQEVRAGAVEALAAVGPAAVDALGWTMRVSAPVVAEAVIQALSQIGDRQSIDLLIETLVEGKPMIRRPVGEALVAMGAAAVEPLLQALDRAPSSQIAEILGRIGDPRAVDPLGVALRGNDPAVRAAAAEALGALGDVGATLSLRKALTDSELPVRQAAAEALRKIGPPPVQLLLESVDDCAEYQDYVADVLTRVGEPALQVLTLALRVGNPDVRRVSVRALAGIGDACALEPLSQALADPEEPVRRTAVAGLARFGSAAVEPLIRALEDDSSHVRAAAATSLAAIRDGRAIIALIKAAEDPEKEVREAAVKGVGKLDEVGDVEALIYAATHAQGDLCTAATRALITLGKSAVEALIAALDTEPCVAILQLLGEIGDARAAGSVVRVVQQSEDAALREAAMDTLRAFGDIFVKMAIVPARITTELIESLQDGDREEWTPISEKLVKMGGDAVGLLIQALQDENALVRQRVAHILGLIGDVRSVGPLITLLNDPEILVSSAATVALLRVRDVRAVVPLHKEFEAGTPEARELIARVLGRIGDLHSLPRKVLRDKRLTVRERVEILEWMARVEFQEAGQVVHYPLQNAYAFCVQVIEDPDPAVREGASAVQSYYFSSYNDTK